ncbi:50S ribosomal protein L22 [Ferrimicrobium acidiphilum]|uniref:Large ribosomal subunit protein uL22 n=1 Tax=Ferrimicrobium acidiphilum DSM 19497 TaxID=1121877 RepID=A0A0D8FYR1_9ACTN|nr:50S ribosomal protein L22 [Ferrimicrobium acidiphilum DSM 19497]
MAQTLEANQARAVLRYFRMSPTKARQVLDLIRGKSAVDAIRALSLVNREASEVVGKLLASAVANATVRYGLGADEVFVAAAFADEGPTIKRFRPRARGRATRIRKRSCHITIVVEEMPLEMRRVEAAKSSGRQSARRAQRVASSRGTTQATDTPALATGPENTGPENTGLANEDNVVADPIVDSVDTAEGWSTSDGAVVEAQAQETVVVEPEVVDADAVESSPADEVPERSVDAGDEAAIVAEDAGLADDDPAVVEEGREDS